MNENKNEDVLDDEYHFEFFDENGNVESQYFSVKPKDDLSQSLKEAEYQAEVFAKENSKKSWRYLGAVAWTC